MTGDSRDRPGMNRIAVRNFISMGQALISSSITLLRTTVLVNMDMFTYVQLKELRQSFDNGPYVEADKEKLMNLTACLLGTSWWPSTTLRKKKQMHQHCPRLVSNLESNDDDDDDEATVSTKDSNSKPASPKQPQRNKRGVSATAGNSKGSKKGKNKSSTIARTISHPRSPNR